MQGPRQKSVVRRSPLLASATLALVTTLLAPIKATAETVPTTIWPTTTDTYVSALKPTVGYGSSKYLNADGPLNGSADRHLFLRFTVSGAPEGPQHTILRLRQTSGQINEPFCDEIWECWHYVRVAVRAVGPGGWDESTTYATAPPTGNVLGVAPAVKVRGYHSQIDIDLGALVDGDGTYDFAVTNDTTTNYAFASREAGEPATLVILP
jgi:hypothetical protein